MSTASSSDLFPEHGARFVFERESLARDETPRYRVGVFQSDRTVVETTITWAPELVLSPMPSSSAVVEGVTKLARALRDGRKSRLIRWREL